MEDIKNMNFDPEKVEDTGLLCPISGNKLYSWGFSSEDPSKEVYGGYNDGKYKFPFYYRDIEEPYFRYNLEPYISSNDRFFLPDWDSKEWKEYKEYTPIIFGQKIYISIDATSEEIKEILGDIRKNFDEGFNFLPLIRKVTAQTMPCDLVSEQPLDPPTKLFYLDYIYKNPTP